MARISALKSRGNQVLGLIPGSDTVNILDLFGELKRHLKLMKKYIDYYDISQSRSGDTVEIECLECDRNRNLFTRLNMYGDFKIHSRKGDINKISGELGGLRFGSETAGYIQIDHFGTIVSKNITKAITRLKPRKFLKKLDIIIGSQRIYEVEGRSPSRGVDELMGWGSNDLIDGLGGNDTLSGGKGKDTFVFRLSDQGKGIPTILDFDPKQDFIHIPDFNPSQYKYKVDPSMRDEQSIRHTILEVCKLNPLVEDRNSVRACDGRDLSIVKLENNYISAIEDIKFVESIPGLEWNGDKYNYLENEPIMYWYDQ